MDPFEPEQGGDAIEQGIEFERLGQEIVMRVIFAMAALEIMDVGGDHQDHRIVAMLLPDGPRGIPAVRSEEHTSELQSLMRISYDVFCLKKKTIHYTTKTHKQH